MRGSAIAWHVFYHYERSVGVSPDHAMQQIAIAVLVQIEPASYSRLRLRGDTMHRSPESHQRQGIWGPSVGQAEGPLSRRPKRWLADDVCPRGETSRRTRSPSFGNRRREYVSPKLP